MQFELERKGGFLIDPLGNRVFILSAESYGYLVKNMLYTFGTGAQTILYNMGVYAKKRIETFKTSQPTDRETLLEVARKLFEFSGWGEITFVPVQDYPFQMSAIVEHCVFASSLEAPGESNLPTCDFLRGGLVGGLGNIFDKMLSVEEVRCSSRGDPHCRFEVTEQKDSH